jgi:hypothetical protein
MVDDDEPRRDAAGWTTDAGLNLSNLPRSIGYRNGEELIATFLSAVFA